MTELAVQLALIQHVDASATLMLPDPKPPTRMLVKPRSFGIGEGSTVPISLATGAALLLAWWGITRTGLVPHLFLPTPAEVITMAQSIWDDGYANATLWEHVSASLARILTAAAIAMALGIPAGLLMGLNRWAKGVLDTPIEFYWPLPPLAYLPLMIIWLGIGEASKITLLTLAMFAPIVLSAQAGVRALPIERVNAALSLGASRWQLFTEVVLPSALPEILTGIRIALGVGWGTLVAAELIAANRGIGYMIMSASHFLATDAVFVGIAVIAVCAFSFTLAMRLAERVLVPWKGKS
jgi:taurine transport system permease protein